MNRTITLISLLAWTIMMGGFFVALLVGDSDTPVKIAIGGMIVASWLGFPCLYYAEAQDDV